MYSHGMTLRMQTAKAKEYHAMTLHRQNMSLRKLGIYNKFTREQQMKTTIAWLDVEEAYRELDRYKKKLTEDPYHEFCSDDPSAPECRVYED
jgi:hypothetical protein